MVAATPPPSPDREHDRDRLQAELVAAGRALGNSSAMLNHACAERLGLHATDWECVSLLNEALPASLTAGQLADLTGLSTGAITGVIDRLESAGYARRERDPADRRRVIVRLSAEKMAEVVPLFAGMLADMVALQQRYSEDDLAKFVELLGAAGDILRRHALAVRAASRD
ncbi:MAG TPA: MarR family transcriptional regulator [Acidimicrobiales bacterium]